MELNAFVREFEGALYGVPEGTITADSRFQELDQWESVALLNIMAMIDCTFNLQLSVPEIHACTTVRAVYEAAEKKMREAK